MSAPPLPEERLDLRDVRAAGDVLDGLVVDGQHGGSREGLAVGPGKLHLDPGLLAGLVGLLRGLDRDVDDPRFGRDDDLAHLVVDPAVGDREGLDEDVRHVARDDADLLDRALAPEVDDLRRQVHAVRRSDEEQHRRIDLVGVDQEPERLAGLVFLALGDDLQVAIAEARAVEPLPDDREQVAALDRVPLAVVDRRREPVLAGLGRLDRPAGLAVGAEGDLPAFDGRLDRLSLGVIGDLQQPERPLAGDRLVVERHREKARLDRVPRAVVAAIDPGVDGERLAGDQHGPRPHDRPARLVGDLGRDLVAMVLVGMRRLGHRGVDLDGERPIRSDRQLGLGHDLGGLMGMSPPPDDRPEHAPARPAGIPRRIGGEPPVARAEEPVPAPGRIPAGVGRRPGDLVLDLRLGDGPAEVIVRLDGRRDLLAEHHRGRRGLDAHLELGLLVLLDPERAAALIGDEDLVDPQRRVGGQLERAVEAPESVGLEVAGIDLLTLGILDLDGEGAAGEIRGVRLVVAGVRDPELEPDRPAGPIDRPVGDRVDLHLVIGGVVPTGGVDVREALVRPPAFGRAGGDNPLVVSLRVVRFG